jgi:hypothetical protein
MQYYACAPNDIWSLGVILVNLTCGRNPWKSASPKDSTFRAYMEDRQFLKTILPLSDELNAILGMIFEMDPTRRIKLPELRQRIINCFNFTKTAQEVDTPIYDYETYDGPLSPVSTTSDEGTMVSSGSDSSTSSSTSSRSDTDSLEVEIMDEDSPRDPEFFDATSQLKTFEPELVVVPSPLIADSNLFQSQGIHQISSHVFPGLPKSQVRDHRLDHNTRTPPTPPPYEDVRFSSRAPSRPVSHSPSPWPRINRWQSTLNHTIPSRLAIIG